MATTHPGFPTTNYDPLFFQVDDSTGCSLTRANIRPFNKSDFAAQGLKEVGMDKIIAQTKEARMAGMAMRTLTDLLLSRHASLKDGSAPASNGSIIAPFTLVPRRNVVNASYFWVTNGSTSLPTGFTAGATHATYGAIPTSAFKLVMSNGYDGANKLNLNTNLSVIKDYFLPGSYLFVETTVNHTAAAYQSAVTGGGGTLNDSHAVQFKVHASVALGSGTCELVVSPSVNDTAWAALSSAAKGAYQITKGTAMIMANSVSDYEQYCAQGPSVNDRTLVEYWQQTSRWTFKYNDEYLKALTAPLTSEFFKKFQTLPLAEQRRQIERQEEIKFYNTVFYGDVIDTNQTLSNWTNLAAVEDPYNSGCALEFKTNTVGIRAQLKNAGRVYDRAGGVLNIDTLMETCYLLKRERENSGGASVTTIDCMTDRFTAAKIRDIMIKYYKTKFSMDVTAYVQMGQKVLNSVTNKAVLDYNVYDLPDQGVSLAVFTDPYFDDAIGAATTLGGTPTKNRARRLWFIDWSDIVINLIKMKSVKRDGNSDVVDKMYNCVIEQNVTHYMLNSKKYEVRVGNTNRHAIWENFSDACPTVTATGCSVS